MTSGRLRAAIERGGQLVLGGDLTVNRIGFGTLQLCGASGWGPPVDRGRALDVLRAAVDAGVNCIDTADSYGPHVAEELVAEALHPYPDDLVVATKCGQIRPHPDGWTPLGRPEYLRHAVELSLRRLRLDRIDLLQLHRVDPLVPVADQFGVLADMQREGKIRHLGVSEVTLLELDAISAMVEVVSVQNLYNVANRAHEPVLEECERRGLAFMPWYPLDTGALAAAGGPLEALARRHGRTPAQLALAWILHRSPNMVLIPGTSNRDHLEENILGGEIELERDDLDALDGLFHGGGGATPAAGAQADPRPADTGTPAAPRP